MHREHKSPIRLHSELDVSSTLSLWLSTEKPMTSINKKRDKCLSYEGHQRKCLVYAISRYNRKYNKLKWSICCI